MRFNFFNLPGELRNDVYAYAIRNILVWHMRRLKYFVDFRTDPSNRPHPHEPALLQASKRIRNEVRIMFYATANFHLIFSGSDFAPAIKWLRWLQPELATLVLRPGSLLVELSNSPNPFYSILAGLLKDMRDFPVDLTHDNFRPTMLCPPQFYTREAFDDLIELSRHVRQQRLTNQEIYQLVSLARSPDVVLRELRR